MQLILISAILAACIISLMVQKNRPPTAIIDMVENPNTDEIERLEQELLTLECIQKRRFEMGQILDDLLQAETDPKKRQTLLSKLNTLDVQTLKGNLQIDKINEKLNELRQDV